MIEIAGILLVAALIIVIQVPGLWRKKQIKELWIFSLLLVTGAALSIAHARHAELPILGSWIEFLYKPVADWVYSMLR